MRFCKSLYYDKAKNVNGYNLRAVQRLLSFEKSPFENSGSPQYYCDKNPEIWCDVINYMNASMTVKYNREVIPAIKDVIFGDADFDTTRYFLRDYWALQVYPIDSSTLKVVTHKESINSYEIAISCLTLEGFTFMVGTIIISIAILKWILPRQPISEVAMEFMRMWTSNSVLRPPTSSVQRFFFLILLVYFMNSSSYTRSSISAINVAPHQPSQIDSFDDLKDSNLSVHGYKTLKKLLPFDKKISKNFVSIDEPKSCIRALLEGHRIACLDSTPEINYRVWEGKQIHISESLSERSISYTTSKYQPLRYKLDYAFQGLNQAGCIRLKNLQKLHYRKIKFGDIGGEDQFEEDTTDIEMIIGVIFFLGGLVFAIITFIIEFLF